MKKQIIYVKLIPRLFATMVDLVILAVITSPILDMIASYVFMWIYAPYFKNHNITHIDRYIIKDLWLNNSEFLSYVSSSSQLLNVVVMLIITYVLFGIYFISFWYYYQATPGKILMRMRIVDSENLQTLKPNQIGTRFLGYLVFFIGIWQVSFSKNKQALHDKLARTVVIKS